MAEEFVLLGAAQTAALESSKVLPTRYALASPNPLPLFPHRPADRGGGGRAKYVAGAFVALWAVASPAAAWIRRHRTEDVKTVPTEDERTVAPPESATWLTEGVLSSLRGVGNSYRISVSAGETITVEPRYEIGGNLWLDLVDGQGVLVATGQGVSFRAERDEVLSLTVNNPTDLWYGLVVTRVAPAPVSSVASGRLGLGAVRGLAATRVGSRHWFNPMGPEGLLVVVRFEHDAGDIDARLLDEQGDVIATSSGTTDVERLVVGEGWRCRELMLFGADGTADVEVLALAEVSAGSSRVTSPSAHRLFVGAGLELRASSPDPEVKLELLGFDGQVLSETGVEMDGVVQWEAPADGEVVLWVSEGDASVPLEIELGWPR